MAIDDQTRAEIERALGRRLDRRDFLRIAALGGTAAGTAALIAACGPGAASSAPASAAPAPSAAAPSATAVASASAGVAAGRAIKIGYVSPATGPLAGFAEADKFIFEGVTAAIGDGIQVGDSLHKFEIVAKDSQSDPARAASVAGELIADGIDLMLVASTPETVNPVSDQCEANGVPCISSVAPWQPYFLGRQAPNTAPPDSKPFAWTYHFFWGLEDVISVFLDMWSQVDTNKIVGGLFPNDGDGNAWGDKAVGFPTPLKDAGYTLIDPGRYENLTSDFSAQIGTFKKENVQVLTGVPLPPDFTTFWTQAAQQGFKPKVASIGKAILFGPSVEALGPEIGDGLTSEVWWSPSHPFKSSLTTESAKSLADSYTSDTGKQWTQPIGFAHALFEVAVDALKRAASVDDKAKIRDAIKATSLDTIVGKIAWDGAGLPPFAATNVAKTPLVGGQWGKGTTFPYDLTIVSNKDHPEIPTAGKMRPIGG
jgi:branched-chain amino acid transport system substrate-binding protein